MKSLNFMYPEARKVEIWEQDVAPMGENDVLCQAETSLMSVGTEIICLRGIFDPGTNWYDWVKYPFTPGYSMVAKILETGKNVTKFKAGDRVFVPAKHHQYFVASEDRLDPIPEEISSEEAAWTEIGRITSNGIRKLQVQMGDFVVMIGAGIIGQMAMQFAKVCGATRIVCIDTDPLNFRLAKAKELVATDTLRMTAAEATDIIREMTEGRMADVVIDATGHPETLAQACPLTRKFGKLLILGDCPTPSKQPLGPGVISNFLNLYGVHSSTLADTYNWFYPYTPHTSRKIIHDLMLQGRLNVKDLITRRADPREAPEIYMGMVDGVRPELGVIYDWTKLYQ